VITFVVGLCIYRP